ncbi:MAG: Hsp20/alpha crystallin family protein [Hydrogenophilales bacterium]|nr:Hsp20/alpha crystallin family protein [Hydrogenophilales bacterium]
MTNIVRRDPYAIDNMLDDLFKGFFVRPVRYSGEMPEVPMIKMDVKEGDRDFTIHAELPGVEKEDIHVTIDGNTVSISAEVKKASEEKEGDKVLRSERYHGKVYRSFSLGQDVDEAGAKAKFDKGVLELVLPKKNRDGGQEAGHRIIPFKPAGGFGRPFCL